MKSLPEAIAAEMARIRDHERAKDLEWCAERIRKLGGGE